LPLLLLLFIFVRDLSVLRLFLLLR
jgi:hypothetical protein